MVFAYVGMEPERAEMYGRQVAVALARGNYDQAHSVIAAARHEFETEARGHQCADPRDMYLNDTPIPARLVSILQSHGMFTVGDMLLAGLSYLAERKNIGRVSVDLIIASLLEVGITRDHFYGGKYG
jgi:hypothetical protein